MKKSSVPPHLPVALPPLVADYVEATNSSDLERLMATFAEDALVNDQLRDYWGKPTIRECWGHMPRHMVAEDLANGTLVELRRRAWHMRPLTFMISQRRGYAFSECETLLVELLGNPQRFAKDFSQRSVSRKGEKP